MEQALERSYLRLSAETGDKNSGPNMTAFTLLRGTLDSFGSILPWNELQEQQDFVKMHQNEPVATFEFFGKNNIVQEGRGLLQKLNHQQYNDKTVIFLDDDPLFPSSLEEDRVF